MPKMLMGWWYFIKLDMNLEHGTIFPKKWYDHSQRFPDGTIGPLRDVHAAHIPWVSLVYMYMYTTVIDVAVS